MKGQFATGTSVVKRLPNATEEVQGFPTGDADIDLFNGLFNGIMSEIRNVITAGGVTPTDGSTAQLLAGINGLIAAATGVGDTSQFLLMSQAAARLPIWPMVHTDDYTFNITSPGVGQARLPADVDFTHRGVVNYTTVETDFTLYPSRTYHVRWNPTDGWQALDLADVAYNPSSDAESVEAFDTTFDDMLVARLVTNALNEVTVTNLANNYRMTHNETDSKTLINSNAAWLDLDGSLVTLNWGRTPDIRKLGLEGVHGNSAVQNEWVASHGMLGKISLREGSLNRYQAGNLQYIYDDSQGNEGHVRYSQMFAAF